MHRRHITARWWALLQLFGYSLSLCLFTPPAWACPLCDSDTATLVRGGLAETFTHWPNIMAATLPFAGVGVVVMAIMAIDRWPHHFKRRH